MRLDIVIPAHNEEQRIDRTLRAYRAVVTDPYARIMVALDCCTDRTAEIVASHSQIDARVEACSYPKLGKGGVLMEAFRRCDADLIGFVDADCATPPSEFLRLVDAARDADGAIATRGHPTSVLPVQRSRARQIDSWLFAILMRAIFRLPYSDTQCGAKVVRRQVVEEAVPLLSSRDFLFDVDLLLTANQLGYRIVEVPTVWLDQAGSHISAAADAKRMAISSLRLWLHHRVLPVPASSDRRNVRSTGSRTLGLDELGEAS
jgi:glycosyltransferase involved in cell wall biosynthesis